jgi:hypothetical protein
MERQLTWLKRLQAAHSNPPIIAAGDIFHRWNSSPELINFAIQHLPVMYSVPGQHDLPYHAISEIQKSAYWTLVEAKKLINLPQNEPYTIERGGWTLELHGFPFGTLIQPAPEKRKHHIQTAVIHDYCWKTGSSYPGAPAEKQAETHVQSGAGYDVLHFGDNHKGFLKMFQNQWVFNGGTFYRRTLDDVEYQPMVGIITVDDTIKVKTINISTIDDVLTLKVQDTAKENNTEISDFVNYLADISIHALDIEEVIKQYTVVHGVSDTVTTEILKLLEQTRHG